MIELKINYNKILVERLQKVLSVSYNEIDKNEYIKSKETLPCNKKSKL